MSASYNNDSMGKLEAYILYISVQFHKTSWPIIFHLHHIK